MTPGFFPLIRLFCYDLVLSGTAQVQTGSDDDNLVFVEIVVVLQLKSELVLGFLKGQS